MQPFLVVVTVVLAVCWALQVVSCIKIGKFRRQFGTKDLEKQPAARLWMRVCRGACVVAIIASFAAPIHAGRETAEMYLFGALVSGLLLVLAASIGDFGDSSDGDSGG